MPGIDWLTIIFYINYTLPQKNYIHSNQSQKCASDDTEVGSFLLCTWLCMEVRPFWHDISSTGVNVPVDPELWLLGNFKYLSFSKRCTTQIHWTCCVAKKCIAVSWKSDSTLLIDRWSVEMNSCIPLEKITYCLRKCYNTFLKIWQPYLDHIGTSLTPST